MPEHSKPYVVWRRQPDGYIDATVGKPISPDTFEILLETHEWLEAAERIRAERTLQATTHEIAELRAANERLHKENDCLKAQNSLLKMHLEDK